MNSRDVHRMSTVTRRAALRSGAAVGISSIVAISSLAARGAPVGPNDQIDVGVIGIGMRGKYLIANLPSSLRVTALCDCSLAQVGTAKTPNGRFAGILSGFAEGDGRTARVYQDYRVMLSKQRFDAVIIAAPDHHHAGAAILAMQAGADVYIEKPLAVTITEGRAIANAAQRYQRLVQVGSQQRTMEINRRACEFIRDGGLGTIRRVEEQNFPGPMPYVPDEFPEQPIPGSLAWDLFCGPTPLKQYNRRLWMKDAFEYGYLQWRGWDLFRDYSGHLMTNWGAHSVDMIQFALGKDDTGPTQIKVHPEQVDRFGDDSWHEKTPPLGTLKDKRADRMRFCPLTMTYGDGTQVLFKPGTRKTTFYGEKGELILGRNDYRTSGDLLPSPSAEEKARWEGDGHVARPHLENWVESMRSRRMPNAPIEVGHRSITVCHLANIAREVGHDLRWDPITEKFGSEDANEMLSRPRRRGFELPSED